MRLTRRQRACSSGTCLAARSSLPSLKQTSSPCSRSARCARRRARACEQRAVCDDGLSKTPLTTVAHCTTMTTATPLAPPVDTAVSVVVEEETKVGTASRSCVRAYSKARQLRISSAEWSGRRQRHSALRHERSGSGRTASHLGAQRARSRCARSACDIATNIFRYMTASLREVFLPASARG